MALTCWSVSLTVSGRESSAEVSELAERDGEFVAELVVGVAQGPQDGLVGLGADSLCLRQSRAAGVGLGCGDGPEPFKQRGVAGLL
jgi:hypothetical protein